MRLPKRDEFLEKFQTAFDPLEASPSFSENIVHMFWGRVDICAFWYNFTIKYILNIKGNLQYNFWIGNFSENSSVLVAACIPQHVIKTKQEGCGDSAVSRVWLDRGADQREAFAASNLSDQKRYGRQQR